MFATVIARYSIHRLHAKCEVNLLTYSALAFRLTQSGPESYLLAPTYSDPKRHLPMKSTVKKVWSRYGCGHSGATRRQRGRDDHQPPSHVYKNEGGWNGSSATLVDSEEAGRTPHNIVPNRNTFVAAFDARAAVPQGLIRSKDLEKSTSKSPASGSANASPVAHALYKAATEIELSELPFRQLRDDPRSVVLKFDKPVDGEKCGFNQMYEGIRSGKVKKSLEVAAPNMTTLYLDIRPLLEYVKYCGNDPRATGDRTNPLYRLASSLEAFVKAVRGSELLHLTEIVFLKYRRNYVLLYGAQGKLQATFEELYKERSAQLYQTQAKPAKSRSPVNFRWQAV